MAAKHTMIGDDDRRLLIAHYVFYRDLDTGARKPTTLAQHHFVSACRGASLLKRSTKERTCVSRKQWCSQAWTKLSWWRLDSSFLFLPRNTSILISEKHSIFQFAHVPVVAVPSLPNGLRPYQRRYIAFLASRRQKRPLRTGELVMSCARDVQHGDSRLEWFGALRVIQRFQDTFWAAADSPSAGT
jgi:hypothetical protein